MTMHRDANGSWEPDWIDAEPDFVPATSIAWLQWHVMYWWATVIDRSFGSGGLKRDDVVWEGSEQAMTLIGELHDTWIAHIDGLRADELESGELTSWPYSDDRPFIEVVAWVNAELMKNVSEMAYVRRITPHYRG